MQFALLRNSGKLFTNAVVWEGLLIIADIIFMLSVFCLRRRASIRSWSRHGVWAEARICQLIKPGFFYSASYAAFEAQNITININNTNKPSNNGSSQYRLGWEQTIYLVSFIFYLIGIEFERRLCYHKFILAGVDIQFAWHFDCLYILRHRATSQSGVEAL